MLGSQTCKCYQKHTILSLPFPLKQYACSVVLCLWFLPDRLMSTSCSMTILHPNRDLKLGHAAWIFPTCILFVSNTFNLRRNSSHKSHITSFPTKSSVAALPYDLLWYQSIWCSAITPQSFLEKHIITLKETNSFGTKPRNSTNHLDI